MLVKGWRNDESHISPTASEQEIDTAIKIIITMYFFATGSYITELESAGHDVENKCSLCYTVPESEDYDSCAIAADSGNIIFVRKV